MPTKSKNFKDSRPRIYIKTFGCQMNVRDSEIILGMLRKKGIEFTDKPGDADIILFNTCSVRQHAEDRVIGNVRKLRSLKKKRPGIRIGVVGCMARRHGELLFKELPVVDMLVGPGNIYELPELIDRSLAGEKVLAVDRDKRPARSKAPYGERAGGSSAFVNIMYGCENFCSYCIVPYVRGKEVSRPKNDIVKEVKSLAEKGYLEVTLLGQNVNSYGKSLTNKISFPELLEELNGIKGIERIRFTTSHPKDAGKALFRAIRDLDKVCEHIHLPLQSGSDKILDLMNRGYELEDYLRKLDLLRELVPRVSVSTDIIVGFPSEKERDFNRTVKAMEKIRFNSAFIFKYSPRPPALSSDLVDDVPDKIKKERNNALIDLQKGISAQINSSMEGEEKDVLVEGTSRMREDQLMGRARDNTPCVFTCDEDLTGRIVKVRVTGASVTTLKAELKEQLCPKRN
jgi:tRNA-2-methylthio-N6-dimethylallyladenosine synthase